MTSARQPGEQKNAERSSGDTSHAGAAALGVDALAMIGGALCLDFVNTAAGRGTPRAKEYLNQPHDLLAWAKRTGLDKLVRLPTKPQGALLQDALRLRHELHGVLLSIARTGSPPAAPMPVLNRLLAESGAFRRLKVRDGAATLVWRGGNTPRQLLWPIAQSAAEVLTNEPLGRLRCCAGEGCGWLFLDRTRNASRRWCEMAVCGNRAKARGFAQRRRKAAARSRI